MGGLLDLLKKFAMLAPLVEQGLLALEPQEKAALDALVAQISSPDLQLAAKAFEDALMAIQDAEIKKLG